MAGRSRLMKEIKAAAASDGVALCCDESNLYHWQAQLQGPPQSPFESGAFRLDILVPEQYPLVAPSVKFRTKIFHPNVHWKTGEVCLDILKTAWTPAWTLMSVCQAVVALMSDSAPDSPLNCDAGNMLRSGDLRGFSAMARLCTLEFATLAPTH